MTSSPGPTPGTSDSAEPGNGDDPTTARSEERTADAPGTADAPPAATDEAKAGSTAAEESAAAEEPAAGTRWADEQPPPAPEGWAQWSQPPGVPPQGGRQSGAPRWGAPPASGQQGQGAQQGPPPQGGGQYGQGPHPGSGWGRPGWQPPQGGRRPEPGQQAAWGWGQGRPQAPKPGVIPLRPLDVGAILDGAVATFRKHWRVIVGATLTVSVLTQALDVVVRHQLTDNKALDDLQNDPNPSLSEVMHAVGGSLAASGLMVLVALIGTTVASALLTVVVSRAVLGRELRSRDAWREVRPHLARVMGLTLLVPLIAGAVLAVSAVPGLLLMAVTDGAGGPTLLGLGMIAGLVGFVWVYFQLSLSAPALVLEKQGIVAAMKRSWKLVRGSWWRVLGVQLLAILLAAVVGAMIQWPFMLIAHAVTGEGGLSLFSASTDAGWANLAIAGIGGALSGAITLPVTAGVQALLYLDQRIRRESLDIELARAAA